MVPSITPRPASAPPPRPSFHEDIYSGDGVLSWVQSDAPSIAQLAQHTAQLLDYPTHLVLDTTLKSSNDIERDQTEEHRNDTPISTCKRSGSPSPLSPSPTPPTRSMSRCREIGFILVTCLAQFLSLAALNQTVAPVIVLAKYFDVKDYGTLSLFSSSFSMSVGTFILPAGNFHRFSTRCWSNADTFQVDLATCTATSASTSSDGFGLLSGP